MKPEGGLDGVAVPVIGRLVQPLQAVGQVVRGMVHAAGLGPRGRQRGGQVRRIGARAQSAHQPPEPVDQRRPALHASCSRIRAAISARAAGVGLRATPHPRSTVRTRL